jgi:hypothetical protein
VPAICDFPDCGAAIDRGLAYVCGDAPFGGEYGCGLYFCMEHLDYDSRVEDGKTIYYSRCRQCAGGEEPFSPTPDTLEWLRHLRDDESWAGWREENPEEFKELLAEIGASDG